jgi:hypothetical protein
MHWVIGQWRFLREIRAREYEQHEDGSGKSAFGLLAIAIVARRTSVVATLRDVPCYRTWSFRIGVIWACLAVKAYCPEGTDDGIGYDGEEWYPDVHDEHGALYKEQEH